MLLSSGKGVNVAVAVDVGKGVVVDMSIAADISLGKVVGASGICPQAVTVRLRSKIVRRNVENLNI